MLVLTFRGFSKEEQECWYVKLFVPPDYASPKLSFTLLSTPGIVGAGKTSRPDGFLGIAMMQ